MSEEGSEILQEPAFEPPLRLPFTPDQAAYQGAEQDNPHQHPHHPLPIPGPES
ncbi:MAG TPA: hypothetical protein VKU00_20775 [Chthonomonadaceae bacterium]|nr:hypothetical protein [Chthonomonadaceae bacterium]